MLLVHGGAWDIPDEVLDDHRAWLRLAVTTGRDLLEAGARATEVVTAVVAVMEGSGVFDAGRGAVLTRSGGVELDAGVMDGATLHYGAVAGTTRVAQPVRVAAHLMEHSDGQVRLLAGAGADAYAEAAGFDLVDPASLIHPREQARYEALRAKARYHSSYTFLDADQRLPRGTVGCVARDRTGRLAAATSTGGTPFRPPGRIGDSPLVGAGVYADAHAAVSSTGWGEAIMTVLLAGRTADRMAQGTAPEEAAEYGLEQMARQVRNVDGTPATGGLIALGADGRAAWAFTTPRMARAYWVPGHEAWIAVRR